MMLFELERAINSGVYYLVRNVQTGTTRVRFTGCPTLADWSPVNKIDNLNRDFFVLCHD